EWVHVQLHQQKGMISLSPPTICNSAHSIIYDELCLGVINPDSQHKYTTIVEELIGQGAEGIILGCTEICMLIGDIKFSVPLFDTTTIHAKEAVNFALEQKTAARSIAAGSV
ncbi:aspartate/glutamate racemase family protein, partial [Acinetobacter baumannii]|uniref:aspartate/glutamate racemase family protein n=1 Tax=Acinetobacter baumannii TaxID=470 RepID=UPI001D0D0500